MLRLVFHLSVIAINVYGLVYDQLHVTIPLASKELDDVPFKSRGLFLTIWCLILQTVYFCIALLNDIFGSNAPAPKRAPIIRKVKDTLFSLAFPVAIYVSLAFWGLYAVDKELIFPDHIEKMFPKWLNHVMHTTVTIFIIIELLTSHRNYPSRRTGTAIFAAFNICYILLIFGVYIKIGVWVYPVLDHLSWPARGMFVVMSVSVALCFYLLGEKVNRMVSARPKENYTNGNYKSH